MTRRQWTCLKVLGGGAMLVLLGWRLGSGPVIDGLRTIDGWTLAAGSGIAVLTTVCCAWRWRLVARGLGVGLSLPAAVAAYYRSQFLNVTVPGGVVGDVHRGVVHGRDAGDVGRGLRAVGWERSAGQVVQVLVTVAVLVALPSPVRSLMPVFLVIAGTAGVIVVAVLVLPARRRGGSARWMRWVRTARSDIRTALVARQAWPGIVIASALVVTGHGATFLIAARTAGSTESLDRMIPLAALVMLAMAVPVNVGGWGPREGVAAWAFGSAGMGAAQGFSTAVVYGVIVLVASLPGAAVLAVAGLRRSKKVAGG
ncbi:lysylphosphatidylglycerol synthase transmembrane domain-containing protein [Nakamurella sp. GG22]